MSISDKLKRPSLKAILKLTRDIGISGAKVMFVVLLAYVVVNAALIIFALVRVFDTGFSWLNIGVTLLVFFLALGFTFAACYLTYRYIALLVIQKVYGLTLQQRTLISQDIVRQVAGIFEGQHEVPQNKLGTAINWSQIVYRYYQSVPVFFQSGITQYLNRIPVSKFIIELKDDIMLGDPELAAEKLRDLIDNFFEENILGSPSNRLTWILLLVNVISLYTIISTAVTK